ncbi:MAG TPA: pesticidal protein Cry7Aa [Flavobacteriales bacterium]|nr:pesticidal protein Cry7Aa [Flavobacteriales bacterium]
MLKVKKEGILLKKTHLGFENEGVLNPAVFQDGNSVHMFYRAVRKGNFSSIGYARFDGPLQLQIRHDRPILHPQNDYESHGMEDPRIVRIDGLFYLTYTAYDGVNALGALATSHDLIHFEKKGLIAPQIKYEMFRHLAECAPGLNHKYFRHYEFHKLRNELNGRFVWNKNIVFFPRRINGKLAFLHRVWPGIQLALINEIDELTLEYWDDYYMNLSDHIIMDPFFDHEASHIGAGAPPIETDAGWLIIYHGVYDSPGGYVYTACAALLDLHDPSKVIGRLPYPLFKPEFEYELIGEVDNVCFPTGTTLFDNYLYIYYGAADDKIACASVSLHELLQELMKSSQL